MKDVVAWRGCKEESIMREETRRLRDRVEGEREKRELRKEREREL